MTKHNTQISKNAKMQSPVLKDHIPGKHSILQYSRVQIWLPDGLTLKGVFRDWVTLEALPWLWTWRALCSEQSTQWPGKHHTVEPSARESRSMLAPQFSVQQSQDMASKTEDMLIRIAAV